MSDLDSCQTLDEFVAITFEHQCGPAARLAGELTKVPGLSLPHASKLLSHGMKGDYAPIVRWLKYMYANSRTLMDLCARGAIALAFETLSKALLSADADVVLWGARLLTRLATEMCDLHPQPLFDWLDAHGLKAVVAAWRNHQDLHAIGALLPLVPPCVGADSFIFFTSTMPAILGETEAYIAFTLEVMPILHAAMESRRELLCDKTIVYLLQVGLTALREGQELPATRSLALDLLAQVWALNPERLNLLQLKSHDAQERGLSPDEDRDDTEPTAAGSVLRALKDATRLAEVEPQLTALTAMVRLFEEFALSEDGHASKAAAALFRALGFALIENHHEIVIRLYLERSLSHLLTHYPHVPIGTLLKPLLKQAAHYGYNNCDFDFFLVLAKHEDLETIHAVQLIQFLAEVCISDALLGRVASIPLVVLVERVAPETLVLDYLEVFAERALARLVPDQNAKGLSPVASTLILETIAKLLRAHKAVAKRISPVVHATLEAYARTHGGTHPGLQALIYDTV